MVDEGAAVEASAGRVVVHVARPVPFGARGEAREVRDRIRAAVSGLRVPPEMAVGAIFAGERRPGTDVENLLLYNIDEGGSLFDRGVGVRFEHDTAPCSGCRYEYATVPPDAGFATWRPTDVLASWGFVPIPAGAPDRLLARTWWALAASAVEVRGRAHGPLAIRLLVRLPEGPRRAALAARVKGLIDGVICALTADAGSDPEAVGRVAQQLGIAPAAVAHALSARDNAPLGEHRLLVVRGAWVQWSPPDDRLVAGSVLRDGTSAATLEVAGELLAVERAPVPDPPPIS